MALFNNEYINIDNLPLVLALDVAGQPFRWVTYQDACYYESKGAVAWSMGNFDSTLHGGISRMTGEQSTLTFNSIIAIRGKVQAKQKHRPVTFNNQSMFRRDQYTCAYCGKTFPVGKLTNDHIIPQSKGGKSIWVNCVTACGSCNRRKSDYLLEDIDMELLYVPYVPCKSEYLILANRRILADQMAFLKAQIKNKNSRVLS